MITTTPWTYDFTPGKCEARVRHAGMIVATVYGDSSSEAEHNAALIAASPALLDKARRLLDSLHEHYDLCDACQSDADALRSAIDEAEG